MEATPPSWWLHKQQKVLFIALPLSCLLLTSSLLGTTHSKDCDDPPSGSSDEQFSERWPSFEFPDRLLWPQLPFFQTQKNEKTFIFFRCSGVSDFQLFQANGTKFCDLVEFRAAELGPREMHDRPARSRRDWRILNSGFFFFFFFQLSGTKQWYETGY